MLSNSLSASENISQQYNNQNTWGNLGKVYKTQQVSAQYVLGIICMRNKAEAKPMQEIIKRLYQNSDFQVVIFDEDMILNQPIENWHQNIHVIIAFQSNGYPLQKVLAYVEKNKCICINGDLTKQLDFSSREKIKEILTKYDIPQPEYITVHRKRNFCDKCMKRLKELKIKHADCLCKIKDNNMIDNIDIPDICEQCTYTDPPGLVITKKYISYQGKTISIPLLEKPINADNHDIYIYKQQQVIQLFRKQQNQSSQSHSGDFYSRKKGCFIYEEFLDSQDNKDLKVYSIYPNYYLCELRKAPYVDGIVNRDPVTGKEIRQQTSLTDIERIIAKRICVIFAQLICGFDILRTTDGRSLVMDINGFSFVKENMHYYDQSANIISKMVVQEINRYNCDFTHQIIQEGQLLSYNNQKYRVFESLNNDKSNQSKQLRISNYQLNIMSRISGQDYHKYKGNNQVEQKSLVSIMQAADLAPKFKYKFVSSSDILFDYFFEENNQQSEYKIRPQYSHERSIQIAQFMNRILKNNLYTFDDDISSNLQGSSTTQSLKQKTHCSQGPQYSTNQLKEKKHSKSVLSIDICLETAKINPTNSYDSSKSEEILHQNLHKVQSNKTLVSLDNDYKIFNDIHTHLENESISIDQQVWQLNQQELDGIKLIYYLISKDIPGVKLQVRRTGKDKQATYIIKWGGYLTAAGARQAFIQGQKYKEYYSEKDLSQNIKIFHSNERRIEKTAKMLILGYIAKQGTQLEQLLPEIANLPSDSNIPDPFEILETKYNNEIVPQLGKTISQIRSKITIDDEVLTFNSKTAKRVLAENQRELNKYMQSTKGYLIGDDMQQTNKMFTAFKQWFDPVLGKVKRYDDSITTHFDALKIIGEKLSNLYLHFENLQSEFSTTIDDDYHSDNQQASSEKKKYNFMYLDYRFFLKSFKYLVNQYIVLNPEFQYDISKIHDIYTFLAYLIIHHKQVFSEHKQTDKLINQLYQLVKPYDEQFMIQRYGPTQLQQALLGEKISYNLLQTIQQDIDTAYNYFRQCDKKMVQNAMNQKKDQPDQESSTHTNGPQPLFGTLGNSSYVTGDNKSPTSQQIEESESKVATFAALSSIREHTLRQSQQEKEPAAQTTIVPKNEKENIKEAPNGKKAVHFYVTDKAHLYTLYNLLTKVQNNLKPYLLHVKQDIFDSMSSIDFVYYEMCLKDYYSKLQSGKITEQDLNNILTLSEEKNDNPYQKVNHMELLVAPHRFIEIKCSFGMANDIFQPVPHNVLPIDEAETFFMLFPFSSICQYNRKIQKEQEAGQSKQKLVSVIGVYRHGDRCPKQKIKIKMKSALFFDFIVAHFNLKSTDPTDISINLSQPEKIDNFCLKLKDFLTQYSNRISNPHQLKQIYDVIKPKPPVLKVEIKFPTPFIGVKECQVIAKYGGTLTQLGELQAQLCGKLLYQQLVQDLSHQETEHFRQTFKNSIHVFTNDEQRVKDTADHFLNQFCKMMETEKPDIQELEILSVVEHRARRSMEQEKSLINEILALDTNLLSLGKTVALGSGRRDIGPTVRQFDAQQLEQINNPYQKLCKLKELLDKILNYYEEILQTEDLTQDERTQIDLAVARFHSVYEAFLPDTPSPDINQIRLSTTPTKHSENEGSANIGPLRSASASGKFTSCEKIKFNVSKIPDVYDLLRFDALHPIIRSQTLTGLYKQAYEQAKTLARFIAPNEFGTNPRNRELITSLIACDLIKFIKKCIKKQEINLFFVSESHIIALINLFILLCDQHQNIDIDQIVDFMGHIILKVYQNEQTNRYRIEVFVSPGSYQNPFKCEYGVPRIIMPTLVGDDYDMTLIEQLSKKVDEYCALKYVTIDLGFDR